MVQDQNQNRAVLGARSNQAGVKPIGRAKKALLEEAQKPIAWTMADYRKLRVWKRSRKLTKLVFKLAGRVRKAGHPELASQMKRCALSVQSCTVHRSVPV